MEHEHTDHCGCGHHHPSIGRGTKAVYLVLAGAMLISIVKSCNESEERYAPQTRPSYVGEKEYRH
ncbi:MAG TPA: hypothetical protein VJK51_01995 [Candidatus Nanoarchaeia archaeon]|nr:hypothetical protein [Candidatus Nanoarchaeia archaeon]